MSLVTGMLAIQSMSSCVTVSHIYYDEGRGKAKDIYCEYEGKRLSPGESYKKSEIETCTCEEDGLKCCKSQTTRKQSGHHDPGDHKMDYFDNARDGHKGIKSSKSIGELSEHSFSSEPRSSGGSSPFDEHGFGFSDQIPHDEFGYSGPSSSGSNRKEAKSSFHSSADQFDISEPSSNGGKRKEAKASLYSSADPFDFSEPSSSGGKRKEGKLSFHSSVDPFDFSEPSSSGGKRKETKSSFHSSADPFDIPFYK